MVVIGALLLLTHASVSAAPVDGVAPLGNVTLTIRDRTVELAEALGSRRSTPATIARGATCVANARSRHIHTVGARTDFYYRVECGHAGGWVFGAGTSLRLAARVVTMRAIFQGAGMGDYFHLSFRSEDPTYAGWDMPELSYSPPGAVDWDFGFGNDPVDEIAGYELVLDSDTANPKLVGKLFEVRWTVKSRPTPPGSGEFEPPVQREVPVIVGLRLLN